MVDEADTIDDTATDTSTDTSTLPSTVLKIPVVKGKGSIEVNTELVPDQYYREALKQGFKVIVNGGASKITAPSNKDDEKAMADYHAAAMEKARERVTKMLAGELKLTGRGDAGSTKVSGEVMTEARRLARQLVKDALKEAGLKVSHYSASEITVAANAMIAQDEGLIKMAEANIAKRKEKPTPSAILATLKPDAGLIKKAEEKKIAAKAKGPISAKQAGKVAPRASHTTH